MSSLLRASLLAALVVAAGGVGCTTSQLRFTFRDPGRVSPPSDQRSVAVYPGRLTPRGPDGSPRMVLQVRHDRWISAGRVRYQLPDGTYAGEGQIVFNDPGYQTLVTEWANVTIEEITEPSFGFGIVAVVTAVSLSPVLMLDSVDANGPFGYTLLGLAAGGIAFELWPASTKTLWSPPRP